MTEDIFDKGLEIEPRVLVSHAEFLHRAGEELKVSDIILAKVQIDNLSLINAQYGANVGDQVIAAVRAMLLAVDRNFLVGQVSTSVYACMCKQADDTQGYLLALEYELSNLNKVSNWDFTIEMSVGLVVAEAGGAAPLEDWVQKANRALLVSSRTGRGTVYKTEFEVELEVRALLSRIAAHEDKPKNFTWVYQPVVNLHTGHTVGYEALVRWDVKGFGLVNPEMFIPLAEKLGVVRHIDRWALEAASIASKSLLVNPSMAMGVNVSAVTLEQDPGFVDFVAMLVASPGFGHGNLVLELTETAVISNLDNVARICRDLGALGVQISIDDFGKGETNLNTLTYLPVDYVKLDKSLLRLANKKAIESMIKIGIEMSNMLGARVLCEGIETDEDYELCKELGVSLGQGWFLGMPQPLEQLLPSENGL